MTSEDDTYIVKGLPPLDPIPTISVGKLLYESLLQKSLDNVALVDVETEKYITYKDLLERSCSLAESLRRSGYGKNSIIAISSANSKEFFIPVFAALYLGAIVAPLNHSYTPTELLHTLKISEPEIIFCSSQIHKKFVNLKSGLSFLKEIVIIDQENYDGSELETIDSYTSRCLSGGPLINKIQPEDANVAEQIAFILCSSGTTGLPKGVMITHHNFLTKYILDDDSRLFKPNEMQTVLGVIPFYHAFGFFLTLRCIAQSRRVVFMPSFNERLFLRSIEKYNIDTLVLVPPLAVLLAKSPLVSEYDLRCVENVFSGAAPLSKETADKVIERLGNVKTLRQGYGMSETTLGVTMMPLDATQKFGSVGKVQAYMLCKVRDPSTGKSLGPNQVGELCFKGPMVMKGYYKNPEATRETFTVDGWLKTGDLGYYDEDECVFIVDRLKELIKYKAFQVAPAELEAILLTNPNVQDAGVVGLPDEDAGELPCAFVVKQQGSEVTEEDIQKFVRDAVSPPKWLRGGVHFVAEIPKNPSGKILRRELREYLKKVKSKL